MKSSLTECQRRDDVLEEGLRDEKHGAPRRHRSACSRAALRCAVGGVAVRRVEEEQELVGSATEVCDDGAYGEV